MCRSPAWDGLGIHHQAMSSGARERTPTSFRLGVALLAATCVALSILAAATDHAADAIFFVFFGVAAVVGLVCSRRYLTRWTGRRPTR
jgi:hypothetical protein